VRLPHRDARPSDYDAGPSYHGVSFPIALADSHTATRASPIDARASPITA
jgi:hypothetical protein